MIAGNLCALFNVLSAYHTQIGTVYELYAV